MYRLQWQGCVLHRIDMVKRSLDMCGNATVMRIRELYCNGKVMCRVVMQG